MSEGLSENAQFLTLTYESAIRVSSNRAFQSVAYFLWLRAGAIGRCIDDLPAGWQVADSYGVIDNLDKSEEFVAAIHASVDVTHAFIVTDEDRHFEALARRMPDQVEPVRLYSAYLRNFEVEASRGVR
jgi:adenine-specific DNA-methyltransferase